MTRDKIISDLFTGKNFCDCISKMEPIHLREDLKQEVILIICELPDEKIFQLYNEKKLDFWTVRVILNQFISNTSPFAKKYREGLIEFNDHDLCDESNSDNISERILKEAIEDTAMSVLNEIHGNDKYWYASSLIKLYQDLGNYRAVGKATGIPFPSIYKTITKTLEEVRKQAVNKPIFSKDELRFIQNNII